MVLRDLFTGPPTLDTLLGELGTLQGRLTTFINSRNELVAEHAQTIAELQTEIDAHNADAARADRIRQRVGEFTA